LIRGHVGFYQAEVVQKEGRVSTKPKTKEISILPNDSTIGSFGTMRTDFLMCGIGSDARGFLYNEGAVVSETLVPFGQARSFQGECDRSGGVSETTNGDADSVVMNSAC
jgi:hypothetical protein